MGKPDKTESAYDLVENMLSRGPSPTRGELLAAESGRARYRPVPIVETLSRYARLPIEKRKSPDPAGDGSFDANPSISLSYPLGLVGVRDLVPNVAGLERPRCCVAVKGC